MESKSLYTKLLQDIEKEILRVLPDLSELESVESLWQQRGGVTKEFQDDQQIIQIEAPGSDLIRRGGKRWRPQLLVLFCGLFGGSERTALKLCPLVELVHNGSLIVDDIEDGSTMRRGVPAVHLKYGIDLSINAGNLLYFLPASCMAETVLDKETELSIYRLYFNAMQRLHYGQGLDILWHKKHNQLPSVDQYMSMCRFKSGSMSGLATSVGAKLGGVRDEIINKVRIFGEELGVCFQIIDDVTNLTTGNPGKLRGDDLIEGKKSLPLILCCQFNSHYQSEILAILSEITKNEANASELIQAGINLMYNSGAIDEAQRLAKERCKVILEQLSEYKVENKNLNMINNLINSLIS